MLIDVWDEPEPLGEYEPELRRQLPGIDNDDAEALIGELRIDQWVSRIVAATAVQQKRIATLLWQLGDKRLRSWLPWLGKQQWTGASLLLFLEFWDIWDRRPHWWASSYWDPGLRCWRPTGRPVRTSLSRDASYKLVQLRLNQRPYEVIDEAWFDDWNELELRSRGFPTFASFAVFRAGFKPGENWKAHLDSDTPDDFDYDDADSARDWYDSNDWRDSWDW